MRLEHQDFSTNNVSKPQQFSSMVFVYIRIGWRLGLYTLPFSLRCIMFTLRKRELCSQNCLTAFLLLLALPSLTRSLNWILVNRFVRRFWASLGCTVRASLADEFWDDLQRLGARDAIEVSSM